MVDLKTRAELQNIFSTSNDDEELVVYSAYALYLVNSNIINTASKKADINDEIDRLNSIVVINWDRAEAAITRFLKAKENFLTVNTKDILSVPDIAGTDILGIDPLIIKLVIAMDNKKYKELFYKLYSILETKFRKYGST